MPTETLTLTDRLANTAPGALTNDLLLETLESLNSGADTWTGQTGALLTEHAARLFGKKFLTPSEEMKAAANGGTFAILDDNKRDRVTQALLFWSDPAFVADHANSEDGLIERTGSQIGLAAKRSLADGGAGLVGGDKKRSTVIITVDRPDASIDADLFDNIFIDSRYDPQNPLNIDRMDGREGFLAAADNRGEKETAASISASNALTAMYAEAYAGESDSDIADRVADGIRMLSEGLKPGRGGHGLALASSPEEVRAALLGRTNRLLRRADLAEKAHLTLKQWSSLVRLVIGTSRGDLGIVALAEQGATIINECERDSSEFIASDAYKGTVFDRNSSEFVEPLLRARTAFIRNA